MGEKLCELSLWWAQVSRPQGIWIGTLRSSVVLQTIYRWPNHSDVLGLHEGERSLHGPQSTWIGSITAVDHVKLHDQRLWWTRSSGSEFRQVFLTSRFDSLMYIFENKVLVLLRYICWTLVVTNNYAMHCRNRKCFSFTENSRFAKYFSKSKCS